MALPAFANCTPLLQQLIDIPCPPGPQQHTCSSGFAAVGTDRRPAGHRTVSYTLLSIYTTRAASITGDVRESSLLFRRMPTSVAIQRFNSVFLHKHSLLTRRTSDIFGFIDTADSMRQGLCNGTMSPSVCLSVPYKSINGCSSVRRVCCCGPGGQKKSVDSGGCRSPQQHCAQQHDIQKQMRAVSRCQLT